MWMIFDWAYNRPFGDLEFNSFDDAEEYLCEYLDERYEEYRGEYVISESCFRQTVSGGY